MDFFRYGNKAALMVGVALMVADSFVPLAHEFGAWPVGCLFAVCYSASKVMGNERIGKRLKGILYVYLVAVFVFASTCYDSADLPARMADRSIPTVTRLMGIDDK